MLQRQRVPVTPPEASALAWVVNMAIIITIDGAVSDPDEGVQFDANLTELQLALVAYAARRSVRAPSTRVTVLELTPDTITSLLKVLPTLTCAPTTPALRTAWSASAAITLMDLRTFALPRHVMLAIDEDPDADSPQILLNIVSHWWARAMVSMLLQSVPV